MREGVAAVVAGVGGVALHPLPLDGVLGCEAVEFLPQLLVLHWLLLGGNPRSASVAGRVAKICSLIWNSLSAATGATDASSGCRVEGGVFAVEWSIRK